MSTEPSLEQLLAMTAGAAMYFCTQGGFAPREGRVEQVGADTWLTGATSSATGSPIRGRQNRLSDRSFQQGQAAGKKTR